MKVLIYDDDDRLLGRVDIYKVITHPDETADYSIRFAIDRVGSVGYHQRGIRYFPRSKYNALALLKQALETLNLEELEHDNGTSASDLARKVRGIGGQVPPEAPDSERNH